MIRDHRTTSTATKSLLASTLIVAALHLPFLAPVARAQATILTQVDFEGIPIGGGTLTGGSPAPFTSFVFGGATPSPGSIVGDNLQGVVASGGGRAGYIGGAGTGLTFSATGNLIAGVFPGLASAPVTNFRGTNQAVHTLSLDFSVSRVSSANQQSFSIYYFDALDSNDTNTSAFHSFVNIAANNRVYVQDYFFNNVGSPWIDTSFDVISGRTYQLTISVNYDASTWSSSIRDSTNNQTTILATNRSTNGGGYSLSGWNDADGGMDIHMFANTVSNANKAFADQLVFDNITISAIPEPSTYALFGGIAALGLALHRKRRRSR